MCVCEQGRKTQADKEVKHTETKRIQRVLGLEGWYIISADCMPPLGNWLWAPASQMDALLSHDSMTLIAYSQYRELNFTLDCGNEPNDAFVTFNRFANTTLALGSRISLPTPTDIKLWEQWLFFFFHFNFPGERHRRRSRLGSCTRIELVEKQIQDTYDNSFSMLIKWGKSYSCMCWTFWMQIGRKWEPSWKVNLKKSA